MMSPPRFLLTLSALLLTLLVTHPAAAQDDETKMVREGKSLVTKDGWILQITYFGYYEKDTPVIIMIPGDGGEKALRSTTYERPLVKIKGSDRPLSLAEVFHTKGYAVITVELRKQGKAEHPDPRMKAGELKRYDYAAMVAADLEAVKKFIYDEHQAGHLNMRKTGVIAADTPALVAAGFAIADHLKKPWPDAPTLAASTPRGQDVRAVALLSPPYSAEGMGGGRAFRVAGTPAFNVAYLIAYGSNDRKSASSAKKIYDTLESAAGSTSERIKTFSYPGKESGTNLLSPRNQKIVLDLYSFFDKYLKELPDPWADRRSSLQN